MEIFEMKDARAQAHKEKVIGKTAFVQGTEEYHDMKLLMNLKIPLHEWREYPIHDKAKVIATQYLSNMMDLIDAHYRELDATMDRMKKGSKK